MKVCWVMRSSLAGSLMGVGGAHTCLDIKLELSRLLLEMHRRPRQMTGRLLAFSQSAAPLPLGGQHLLQLAAALPAAAQQRRWCPHSGCRVQPVHAADRVGACAWGLVDQDTGLHCVDYTALQRPLDKLRCWRLCQAVTGATSNSALGCLTRRFRLVLGIIPHLDR